MVIGSRSHIFAAPCDSSSFVRYRAKVNSVLEVCLSETPLTAPWDMKQDNPYLLAQLGFEPTPSLGVSFHIKKDLNAKATEPRRLHSKL